MRILWLFVVNRINILHYLNNNKQIFIIDNRQNKEFIKTKEFYAIWCPNTTMLLTCNTHNMLTCQMLCKMHVIIIEADWRCKIKCDGCYNTNHNWHSKAFQLTYFEINKQKQKFILHLTMFDTLKESMGTIPRH